MTENLKALLIKHEGLELKPYKDSMGYWTIGVGHNMDVSPLPNEMEEYLEAYGQLNEAMALELLDQDIEEARRDCLSHIPWFLELDDVRQDMILDMVFNVGILGFLKFHRMLIHLEMGDYRGASVEMLESKWAQEVGSRARELSKMMETGQYPKR